MYTVYVLKSLSTKKSYVGMTDNLERRLNEHNQGKSMFTKKFIPWEVIYKEDFEERFQARNREKYFKSGAGRNFLKSLF